jgi:uncharacterized damage-inducible protein DinB
MDAGIQFADLLAYSADETSHWKRWFAEHPAALDLQCDVSGAGTVRKLIHHIFATELFFANHLHGLPRIDFERRGSGTLDELFSISEEAHLKLKQFLDQATTEDWATLQPLGFRDLKATPRKMLIQTILHGVHHRGQLATFLRQQGLKQDWTHDIILSKVME